MTTGRATAKQAIEILKVHQIRKENAVIYEEVKSLRKDVVNRQNDLDEARRDVSKLTDEIEKIQGIVCDYETRLAQLNTGSKSCAEEFKGLQNSHKSLSEELSKTNTAFDAKILQNQSTIKELTEEVTLLRDQFTTSEETWNTSISELRDGLASRAERGVVAELEDKLEDFVQEMDARLESLQKASHVTDSFATVRDQQSGKCDRPHSASFPTTTVPPGLSNEHGSDRGRWELIGTQAALRATPPAMPETMVFSQAREDTEMQTPSTLRSSVIDREMISNITHTQPLIEYIPAKAPKHLDPPVSFQVAQQQAPAAIESVRQHVRTDWEALNEILKLRQRESEGLPQYLARFQAITTRFPADCDIISVILKRLVVGMRRHEEKRYVREWLTTSDWTLENVQDCILLLARCNNRFSDSRIELGSPELHGTTMALVERCNSSHDLRQSGLSHPHSNQNLNTGTPIGGHVNEQGSLPQQIESHIQRVQPARRAKTQKTGKVDEGDRHQNGNVDATHQPKQTNDQQGKTGENVANTESVPMAQINAVVEPSGVQQSVAVKKKYPKNRLERELKSLLNTRPIEKSEKGPVKPKKRKALHQSDEETQPVSRPDQELQSTPARRYIKPKRVPTLVARNAAKALIIPETSDAPKLPLMPIPPDADHERENEETRNVGRQPSHESASILPVLTLSPSDFDHL